MADEAMDDQGPTRPCAYCGTPIHELCHRCPHCGGHVGIAWKTVDAELFGLIFAAVLIGVGSLSSWTSHRPSDLHGSDTIRGTAMLALSVYALFQGVLNVYHRRHVIWPSLLNATLALWVSIGGILDVSKSEAWKAAQEKVDKGGVSLLESYVGWWLRQIPPGFLLLLAGGALVAILLLKGIVAGAGSAAAKSREKEESKAAAAAERRARRSGKPDGGADTAPPAAEPPASPPSETPPETPPTA